jgi:hypothetical protein
VAQQVARRELLVSRPVEDAHSRSFPAGGAGETRLLGGALLGDRFEALADLGDVRTEVVGTRQRGE